MQDPNPIGRDTHPTYASRGHRDTNFFLKFLMYRMNSKDNQIKNFQIFKVILNTIFSL